MIGDSLTIIGLLLTIAFGIYSIWVYKKSKRKVSLELKNDQCYSLFRDDVARLNIEIAYNQKTLINPLILFKAKIVNNGSVDIDRNRIFKPLNIISGKDFVWIEAKSTMKSNGVSSTINIINENQIQIEWDLLKKEECIEFEALIEIKDNFKLEDDKTTLFYEGLNFDYRITDLNKIQKEKKAPKIPIITKILLKYPRIFSIFIILVGLLFLYLGFFPSEKDFLSKKDGIELIVNDGTSDLVGHLTTTKDYLVFNNSETNQKTNFTIEEFNKKIKIYSIKKTFISEKDLMEYKTIGLFYFAIGVAFFLTLHFLNRKKKQTK